MITNTQFTVGRQHDDMALFWHQLQQALLHRGGSDDDLLLISRRQSEPCFNLLAGHVLALAETLRSAVHIVHHFPSAVAVLAAAHFQEQGLAERWARETAEGRDFSVSAELCIYTPSPPIKAGVLTQFEQIEQNGFRAANVPELVAWCLRSEKGAAEQLVTALGETCRGRNGCVFVPCAGLEEGRIVQWWEHYGTVCRRQCSLLVACRE